MKKATFIALIVPVIFLAASTFGPLEESASADSRRGYSGRSGGGSVVGRGGFVGRGGGDAIVRHGTRGGHSVRGDYVGRGGYTRYGGHRGYGGYRGHGGHSHSSFSTSIWFGPGWGFYDPFYYPYYPYYRYPYYAPPSTTIIVPEQTQEYIQQVPEEQDTTGYWYFCKEKNGYYPYVERCPSGWMKVVPYTPPPPDQDQED